jgi:hypothetical protein
MPATQPWALQRAAQDHKSIVSRLQGARRWALQDMAAEDGTPSRAYGVGEVHYLDRPELAPGPAMHEVQRNHTPITAGIIVGAIEDKR